jgi:hypothetical protein
MAIKWLGGNGNWTTGGDWSNGLGPGPSDDAEVDATGGYTVTINTPITVGSITVTDASATLFLNDPGQTVTIAGALTISNGALLVDTSGGEGGTSLSIGGTFTNSNFVSIGNGGLGAATAVSAAALSNASNATINLNGGSSQQATLNIAGPAGFGTAGVLTGSTNLGGTRCWSSGAARSPAFPARAIPS